MTDSTAVIEKLKTVQDPELHQDIISLNMVRDLQIENEELSFSLILTTPACPLSEKLLRKISTRL